MSTVLTEEMKGMVYVCVSAEDTMGNEAVYMLIINNT